MVSQSGQAQAAPPPNSDALDFDILPGLLGYQLRRAQLRMFNDFAGAMADVSITPGQFGVLVLIEANPGSSQSALARAIGIERSTMVAVIDTLEGRGLVERRASKVDRRSNALVLSEAGAAMMEKLRPIVAGHEDRIAGNLSSAERRQLIDLLTRLPDGPQTK
ncbi:MAG: winged helix-turn-helix transcriptional regulator [Rhodospirillaceae bacterium]|nr:winged helix-turn-helix transcriptional regulator [Rhodospirillaceae bacterium]MBT5839674.1 winged helix-turn-helix transcriptional regulator [Rhodospirillaceae bacterium]